MSRTLYDKLVDAHQVCDLPDGDMLIYVDFHIMNEYTSPQAFSGLDTKGLSVWRPEAHLAVVDHVNATRSDEPHDAASKLLIDNLEDNCTKHDIAFYGLGDPRQGIEHVVVPEQGLVTPGMLIACGDSHTTTYGAYGALGFGIGTSEVEHVLATQTLRYKRMKTMRVMIDGETAPGVTAKDIIMKVVQVVGAGGANGFAVEFAGSATQSLDMAGRMTVCNMAVELGARAALIAVDEVTEAALQGHAHSGQFAFEGENWMSDPEAVFDKEVTIAGSDIEPLITWGTSPDQSVPITANVPVASDYVSPKAKAALDRSLKYMGLTEGQSAQSIKSTQPSLGLARTAGSKTCARRPRYSKVGRLRWASKPSSCPALL